MRTNIYKKYWCNTLEVGQQPRLDDRAYTRRKQPGRRSQPHTHEVCASTASAAKCYSIRVELLPSRHGVQIKLQTTPNNSWYLSSNFRLIKGYIKPIQKKSAQRQHGSHNRGVCTHPRLQEIKNKSDTVGVLVRYIFTREANHYQVIVPDTGKILACIIINHKPQTTNHKT